MPSSNNDIESVLKLALPTIAAQLPATLKRFTNEYTFQAHRAFRSYLISAKQDYSQLRTILNKNEPVFLYDYYVPLNVRFNDLSVSTSNINNIDSISKHLIISATAGSGKTTLLRHFFLEILNSADSVPILVELRNVPTNRPILDYIYDQLKLFQFKLPVQYLYRALVSGAITLLIDGFDEVAPSNRAFIAKEIKELQSQYRAARIIVTTRPDDSLISWHAFHEVEIEPLTRDLALRLVTKVKYTESTKTRFIKDLRSGLFEDHKDFLSIPLLLIIMLMNYDVNASVPASKHVFYDEVFHTLYNKHDATKDTFKRQISSGLTVEPFEQVLCAVAIQAYSDNQTTMSGRQLQDYITEARRITGIKVEPEAFIADLLASVCVLVQDGLFYSFSHRSFLEYFAIRFIQLQPEDIQRDFLDHFAGTYDSGEAFALLHGLLRSLTECYVIVPRIRRLTEASGSPDRPDGIGFKRLFRRLYESFDLYSDTAAVGDLFEARQFITEFLPRTFPDCYEGVSVEIFEESWDRLIARLKELTPERSADALDYVDDDEVWDIICHSRELSYRHYEGLYKVIEFVETRQQEAELSIRGVLTRRFKRNQGVRRADLR